MKIVAFEVREDEWEDLLRIAEENQIEITMYKEQLTVNNAKLAEGADGITILGYSQVQKKLLDILSLYRISVISTRAVGFNHIDVIYAEQLGIRVCNASYDPDAVAEYTIMLMLMTIRNVNQAIRRNQINDYTLAGLQGLELRKLKVGIIGTGRIGAKVIQKLSGFQCRIFAYDKFQNQEVMNEVTYVTLDEIYGKCDIISLHCPLMEETTHMIDQCAIEKMKEGVIIINCARGELMSHKDIIKGIEDGKIRSLGLDTIEGEKGIFHEDKRNTIIRNKELLYLKQFSNVILTQHIAFYTNVAVESMARCGIENIKDCLLTGKSQNLLNCKDEIKS